eukprot:scaffold223865_cov66-Attheya_sp.AAC.5
MAKHYLAQIGEMADTKTMPGFRGQGMLPDVTSNFSTTVASTPLNSHLENIPIVFGSIFESSTAAATHLSARGARH